MPEQGKLKIWAGQIRAPFLLLSIVLVLIGGAVAYQDEMFNGLRVALCMIGVILAHVSVNLFNELSDYRTGIDEHTNRTPFSGGSGSLQAKLTTPKAVFTVAVATLLIALTIGIYLSWVSSWMLMAFIVAGGVATVFYTSHMSRFILGELAAGSCLGTFVILGTYFSQTSTLTPTVIWLSIPPGILTALLLLLNEFPDAEADRTGGRKHLVIALGRKRAALLYTVSLLLSYVILVLGVVVGQFPLTVLVALLTLPLAAKAIQGALKYNADIEKLVPALGANVGVVLGTDLLIAVGYFIN